jgi:predicted  nucleic acid-binding Zn-ribbon protein
MSEAENKKTDKKKTVDPATEALRKEEAALEEKMVQLAEAKAAAMDKFEEEMGALELQLRETRYKLVDGGHYKSWYQAVMKES